MSMFKNIFLNVGLGTGRAWHLHFCCLSLFSWQVPAPLKLAGTQSQALHVALYSFQGSFVAAEFLSPCLVCPRVQKMHEHVNPKTKEKAPLIATDVYNIVMEVSPPDLFSFCLLNLCTNVRQAVKILSIDSRQ